MKKLDTRAQVLEVAGEVQALAAAYRQRLKLLVENSHVMRPDELQLPLRVMRELMEMEGELIQLHHATGKIDLTVFDDLEQELRGLRDSIGRIVATSIVHGIYEDGYLPENYGVVISERPDGMGFNLEIPYDMISMSDLFMLRSKKIAKLDSLFTVRQAWIAVITKATQRLKLDNSIYPMHQAQVDVRIEIQASRPLDPDHFWLRPILDGLVESKLLVNDNAERVIFMLGYTLNTVCNLVRVEVTFLEQEELKRKRELGNLGYRNKTAREEK